MGGWGVSWGMACGSMLDFIWIRWMGWTFSIHGVHEGGRCFSRWGRLRACGLCSLSPGATPTAEAERLLERSEMDVRAINIPRSMTSESELQSKEISTQSSLLHTANLNLNTNLHTPPHESKNDQTTTYQYLGAGRAAHGSILCERWTCLRLTLLGFFTSTSHHPPPIPAQQTYLIQPTHLTTPISPSRTNTCRRHSWGRHIPAPHPLCRIPPFSRVNFINDMKHISDRYLNAPFSSSIDIEGMGFESWRL